MANEFIIKNGLIIEGGGGLQMSGSLGITGSLNVSSVVNAGTDTDKFLVLDTNGNVDFRTGAEVLSDINPGSLISSSAQIATQISGAFTQASGGFSTRITALEGGGYVDVGTGASGSRLAIWQDGDTIKGDNDLIYYSGSSSTFYAIGSTHGLAFFPETVAAGIKSPTLLVDSIIVGDSSVGTGNADFTSSFTMMATTGQATFSMETILAAATLTGAQSATTIHTTKNAATALWVNYHINRNGGHRVGQLMVAIDASSNVTLTDVSTDDIGGSTSDVSFSATAASGIIQLKITSAGSISYEIEVKKLS